MEQSRQAQMNNYKAFGRRPGNRNLTVEKAKDKKGTLKRLIAYFAAEKDYRASGGCYRCSNMFGICTKASE